MIDLVIIGAGGQAREARVRALAARLNGERFNFLGYVVSDLSKLGTYDDKEHVIGDFVTLRALLDVPPRSLYRPLCLHIGIGDARTRLHIADELEKLFPNAHWPYIGKPLASEEAGIKVGHGVMVAKGVCLSCDIILGDHVLLNQGVTVGHDARIMRAACIQPGANIGGNVTIGPGAYIGTGAQVLQRLTVGARAIVGAGAVVLHDVPDGATVVGVPARVIRP